MALCLARYVCFVIVSLVCLEDALGIRNDGPHPAADFAEHTVVTPKIYHGREKRRISDTGQQAGHVPLLGVALEIDGEPMTLDLTLNQQLIPKGFFVSHQEGGGRVVREPKREEIDHCHYNGKVRGRPDSWAAISTCDGLSGVVFDGTEMHYVEKASPSSAPTLEQPHLVYKHSDLKEHNKTCGYAGGAERSSGAHNHSTTDNRFLRYKRSTDDHAIIRGPYNANKDSKYVELVLVVDKAEYTELGESRTRVVNHCKSIANIINGLYSPLNIFIALVGVVIWTEKDEIVFSKNGDTTLTNFLHYRKEKLIFEHPNDNAQLLTKFNFDQGVVGKALKGPMCTYEYSGGVNTDHSPVVGLVATTIAHEMGHNFGMEHDTVDCKCPDERCIMAPSSSTVAPTHWSSCSLNYLLLAFTHGMDYCLKNKPEALFDGPVCGNGFVEPGEQCDCGLPEHCENPCCDASICMLHSNASCATGECCDLTTCKPKGAGSMCRSADYECDLPEYCTGQSEFCPPDIFKMDTEECDDGKAFCYRGFCRTRNDQCKLLWGETGQSSDDQCYDMNIKGSRHGNCGYNKFNQSYAKCDSGSVLCGMLHCKHLNERLEFGMESVSILSHSFINKKGSIIPCRTAIVDLGTNQIDPGMTPDGAKCGQGKMCVNQRCMDVENLRKQTPICKNDCHGNGWCNSKGHCHCKDGFAPPYCEYPGPGGSEDSGPASDPNDKQAVIVAMYIIFLGIVPTAAIIGILIYYARNNVKLSWNKSPSATSKPPNKPRGPPFPSCEASKRTEANHSLLHEESPPPKGLNNEFFGNFKGFSLTLLRKEETPEPVRPAPPPPPPVAAASTTVEAPLSNYQKPPPPVPSAAAAKPPISQIFSKPLQKVNSFKSNGPTAPALPPMNPGSTARPIISSPVLESSTSNAKELISPLRNKVPSRHAPETPALAQKVEEVPPPQVIHTVLDVVKNEQQPLKKVPSNKENIGTSTINRIASFLKPADKKPVPSSQVKAQKVLDKETLRSLKISDPVPQTEIEIAVTALPVKAVVMRAQSMKATKPKQRPNIQTFGSMRQPGGSRRPLSIPSGMRPKSPPPPAPTSLPLAADRKPNNEYDDCMNEAAPLARLSEENSPVSGDNIYAVIEETPSSTEETPKPVGDKANENLGLLGEIVSEIQNRNFDSIYSTSTLSRKKKEAEENKKKQELLSPNSSEYANTSSNEYSNMSGNLKSSASSTSSGYILPSAVNVPVVKEVKSPPEPPKASLTSFRKDASTRPFGNNTAADNTSDKSKVVAVKPKSIAAGGRAPPQLKSAGRQITPPNLVKGRKPSPSRPVSQASSVKSNRSVTNSPDLVTSCNGNSGAKGPPDVLNGGVKKPAIIGQKPSIKLANGSGAAKLKEKRASVEVKPPLAGKMGKNGSDSGTNKTTASAGVKQAARSNSNVASLQQKFEEKNGAKTAGTKAKS